MNRVARLAGPFYLLFIVSFALAGNVRSQFIVPGDAAATAYNIAADELLFRLGLVTELFSALFFFLAAWALYALLRPVHWDLAVLFLLLNLAGVVVECINTLNLFAALPLFASSNYLVLGHGGMERFVLYPVLVWIIGLGALLAQEEGARKMIT